MNATSRKAGNIFGLPDEILVKIILQLDSTDRLALSNSSQRFHDFLFEKKDILGNFDSSKGKEYLPISVIREYMNNRKIRHLILKVNVRYTSSMEQGGRTLKNLKCKATNLVDVKIHGKKFKDVPELRTFLEPLLRVKHLSVDWPPKSETHYVPPPSEDYVYLDTVQKKSNRLTYLAVTLWDIPYLKTFLRSLKPCTDLKELHIVVITDRSEFHNEMSDFIPEELDRLEIVEISGFKSTRFKHQFISSLPEPEKWTEFQLVKSFKIQSFHLERKYLEICEELQDKKLMEPMTDFYQWEGSQLGRVLLSDVLVKSAIRITHENAPQEFCCLKAHRNGSIGCALKIDEAKLLLKCPRHPITSIYLNHDIEPECDVHLFAAAFPKLTQVVLSNIVKSEEPIPETEVEAPHAVEAGVTNEETAPSLEFAEPDKAPVSFGLFVSKTPNVKELTVDAFTNELEDPKLWDLESLYLISNWKNLRSLSLLSIPITNGMFLVDIGRECPNLETIMLYNLGPEDHFCYMSELSQMLNYCRNLKDFAIEGSNMGDIAEVFSALIKNLPLEKIRLMHKGEVFTVVNLLNSVKKLLRRCTELHSFVCIIDQLSQEENDDMRKNLRRLKKEFNRPNFNFQLNWPKY